MMIVPRSGFTEELREFAEPHGALLVGMDEIMGRRPFPSIDACSYPETEIA